MMKVKFTPQMFSLGFLAIAISACSTVKVATDNNDDVYFSDVSANSAVYVSAPAVKDNYNDRNGYSDNDYYEDVTNSRLDFYDVRNNYAWRDHYYRNNFNYGYDPFFSSNNFSGFNNGWSLGFNFGSPFYGYNNFNGSPFYGYNNFNNFNGWNNFGSFYGNSPYGGMYSYYRPGYYGNYGGGYGYGGSNGYYGNPSYSNRPNTPRPNGSYDNRTGNSTGNSIPYPTTRPVRNSSNGSNGAVSTTGTRNPNGSGSTTTRPTRTPVQQSPTTESSRPTRTERPTYTPPPSQGSDSGRSSSGSSSSGGSSSPRPTRPGGN
ncbi:hypothetical protein [Pedobacter cryophilus]|uniref:Prolyl-tRNA synthetase n=1 Tax=Pedobacter cryophilus TaxID=2571271 RepID=A0A4U1BXI3_9SPHI|nr:hypothetical protein [Pedobacter cryophilus]TKB96016.1 hypothetical protein FA046_15220 [Pedobacter cryophilus]